MASQQSTDICASHLGAQAELVACAWLMGLGYEVFRNVSPVGPADLVIWHPTLAETHFIDVKGQTVTYRDADGERVVYVSNRRHEAVHYLVVAEGIVVGFFRRSHRAAGLRYWPLGVTEPTLPEGYAR